MVQQALPPDVLLVTGPPASGKSTVGRRLAHDLWLPYLSKDLFKESLFDTLGWQDRAWSKQLGGASMGLLYKTAEALLEAGQSLALECNFYKRWDTPRLLELRQRYGCRFVQVVCWADGPTLVARYAHRARSVERHPGHCDAEHVEEWSARLLTERWDALPLGGPVVAVDTSHLEELDYDPLLASVAAVLNSRSASASQNAP
jgi:predicted kinase